MAKTPKLTSYSFDEVTATLGAILLDGYQDGEGISIEQTEAGWKSTVGADGKVTRAKMLDKTATIYLRLMQTSAANDFLSALYEVDQAAPNGAGVVPLFIRDRSGRSLHTAAEAWIQKKPDPVYDRTPTPRVWEIAVADLKNFIGGG